MTLATSYTSHIQTLQAGYEAALNAHGFDAVILHSGWGRKQREVDDQYWPLKANPSFSHWVPLTTPGTMVVVRPGQTPLLIEPLSDSFWEGAPKVPGDHFWAAFERIQCAPDSVSEHLPKGRLAWIGDDLATASALLIVGDAQNHPELQRAIEALRVRKSTYEIDCLRKANQIAMRGHSLLSELFAEEQHSELQLHLAYLGETSQDSGDTPYSNIVAQGSNAAILHHVLYERSVDRNADQSLLVDAGATVMGYASDITRTTVRGQSSDASAFRGLVDGMIAIEKDLCALVVPGLPYEDLHNKSHEMLAELLLESSLCTGDASALVETGITRAFFPHGLGHSLGLQVHDVGCRLTEPAKNNPFLRNTSTIAEGQVFTIEPGCYFIDALLNPLRSSPEGSSISWPTVDALRPFGGIRIEDNLAVTATSSENLTRGTLPSEQ